MHQSLSFLLLSQEPWHHFGTHLPHALSVNQFGADRFLSIPTSLAMTQIVKRRSLQTNRQTFSMLVSVVKVQGKASLTSNHPPCLPQITYDIQKLLIWTWKNLHKHHATSSKSQSLFFQV